MVYWLGILVVFLVALLVFRGFVRRDYRRQGSLSLFSIFLEFLIFGLHANLPSLYFDVPWPQMPPLPESPSQLILGLTISALGLLATLAFMAHLGFSVAFGNQPEGLRQTGPYSWSRNPQLVSYGVLVAGCVILYPSWQAVAWLVLYGVIAHIMVITEEEHLESLFGEEYQSYCSRVPRYLGFKFNRKTSQLTKE